MTDILLPPEVAALKARITASNLSSADRDIIFDFMNLGNYSGQHKYPAKFGPGSSRWATETWKILDQLAPGKLTTTDRFMLGGMIAGALSEMFKLGLKQR